MRKRSELFFSFILVPIDFLALAAAFVVAYIVRVKVEGRPVAHPIAAVDFLQILLVSLPFLILIFALAGLYSQSSLRGRFSELGKVFVAVSGGVMFMILYDFMQAQPIFPSKAVPIYAYGLGLLFVWTARLVVRQLQRTLFKVGIGVHQALLVGSGPLAQRIAADLATTRSGYRLLGVIDTAPTAARRMRGFKVYASLAEAQAAMPGQHLDELIQADSDLSPDELLELVNYATNHQVAYRFTPNQFGLYTTNSEMGSLAGIPMIEIKLTPLDGWGRINKRVFDVLGSLAALAVLAPVFVLLAVIIKLTDPGPVFYRHRRLSRSGHELYMYKFRSMKQTFTTSAKYRGKTPEQVFETMGRPELAAEFKHHQKVQHDPRVSAFGRFLRHTSLDEFPQFFNVLKGDMSLVGPRPIVPAELKRYGNQGAVFMALKPGITGLWQISGRSDIGYEERVKLDIYYVENWSLLLDIKILLKTVAVILLGKGAY
jgi:exopolysaccharide biosynthesis polyprenyl glycosylphosphotransferase